VKKQKELLDKLKNPKKAPPRNNETSVGEVMRRTNPSPQILYNILSGLSLPVDVSYRESEESGWELTIGELTIKPCSEQKEYSCIEGQSGLFLRPYNAVIRAFALELGNLIKKGLNNGRIC
jgi:hypothetical protein